MSALAAETSGEAAPAVEPEADPFGIEEGIAADSELASIDAMLDATFRGADTPEAPAPEAPVPPEQAAVEPAPPTAEPEAEPAPEADAEPKQEPEPEEDVITIPKTSWDAQMQRLEAALGGQQAPPSQEPEPPSDAPGEAQAGSETAPPALQPPAGVPPIQVPPMPPFELSREEAEEIGVVDADKFCEVMTEYGQAVAAQTTQALLQTATPQLFIQLTQVWPALAAAHEFQVRNPEFRRYPLAVQQATREVLAKNPGVDPLTAQEMIAEHLGATAKKAKRIAKQHGGALDARPKTPPPPGTAPGGRKSPKNGPVQPVDPTEAALDEISQNFGEDDPVAGIFD